MASKIFQLPDVGVVKIAKRKSRRNLRLSISPAGEVKVSIPAWAPYSAGVDFAKTKKDWIIKQLPKSQLLMPDQMIGKAHRLTFIPVNENGLPIKTLIKDNQIRVFYPNDLHYSQKSVQASANAAAIRALRKQAESLLPKRVDQLAQTHGMEYKDVKIKRLTRRWGSCDRSKHIVLNLFLIQLPWELIDYVILHELAHTKHLNHGPDFWSTLEGLEADARGLRRQIRNYRPEIISQ